MTFVPRLKWLRPPGPALLLLLILASAGGLVLVFRLDLSRTAPAYAVYAISTYTLVMALLWGVEFFRRGRTLLHQIPFTHRYLAELDFRAEVSLRLSLLVDVCYCAYKTGTALYCRSTWFGALAFYYTVLAAERFFLLHDLGKTRQDPLAALRKYRSCGALLLILTAAVAAIGCHAIFGGSTVKYPGHMIYGAAAYTFYKLFAAIVNLIRYRRLKSPVYTASKVVALAAALTALFSLQTAMLAAFGGDTVWQAHMNALTGCGVLILITALSLAMLLQGHRKLRDDSR